MVSGEMFSHAFEPVVRFTKKSIAFNATCIGKLNRVFEDAGGMNMERCPYVEMLINPVERMLVVRPGDPEHPNAMRWAKDDGTSAPLGASAFCSRLFRMMDWEEDCGYRVPAVTQSDGGSTVLVFDLDNYIGIANKKGETVKESAVAPKVVETEHEDTQGIFYGADDEEPQEIEDLEKMTESLRRRKELEARTFGTPAFAHNSDIRLLGRDDGEDDDFTAEAKPLDVNHRVDDEVLDKLKSHLEDALYVAADDEPSKAVPEAGDTE